MKAGSRLDKSHIYTKSYFFLEKARSGGKTLHFIYELTFIYTDLWAQ